MPQLMNLSMLLEMAADPAPDRALIGDRSGGLTSRDLLGRARAGVRLIERAGVGVVLYLGGNAAALPVALFSAGYAGVPFLPLNYRLSDEQLAEIIGWQGKPLVVTDTPERVPGLPSLSLAEFMTSTADEAEGSLSEPAAGADVGTLRAFTRARLRSSRTPDQFVFVSELPTNTTGKVVRRDLAALVSRVPPAPL
jgi:acyl-CoA synthetase (AMP-forming)/AMP-acid ligase II